MSIAAALEVVIGLAFTYLLLGMIASGFQELFAALINKRGKELRAGIAQLLAGIDATGRTNTRLADTVLGHSLIDSLSPKKGAPSYVPARNFALALIDTLSDGSHRPVFSQIENSVARLPEGAAKESLTALLKHAGNDIDALQKSIEIWFDDSMDRVTGIYKRFSQYFT